MSELKPETWRPTGATTPDELRRLSLRLAQFAQSFEARDPRIVAIVMAWSALAERSADAWAAERATHQDFANSAAYTEGHLRARLEAAERAVDLATFVLVHRPGDITPGRAYDLALEHLRRYKPTAGYVAALAAQENSHRGGPAEQGGVYSPGDECEVV